ncbi:MAG: Fe-S cluster assembly protein SufD [Rhodothermales bacterium]|nr:Fe-S cluster assembly protein SufD [Rhodothermales bacterium]
MSDRNSIESRLLQEWESRAGSAMNGRLHDSRAEAIKRFRDAGIPALRSEAWKYTPIRRILDRMPTLDIDPEGINTDGLDLGASTIEGLDAYRVVLVDGRFQADLSDVTGLPKGARILDLRESSSDEDVVRHLDGTGTEARDAFAELNSAFVQDGVAILVDAGVIVPRPILIQQIVTAQKPSLVQPRLLGVFGRNSQARLVEVCSTAGQAEVLTNAFSEFHTATGAVIDHVRLIDEHAGAVHINNLRSYQEGGSNFSTNVITVSAGTVRNQSYFLPDGEHCETHLSGFYLAQDGAHIDNHTLVDHAKPECYSNELFKGILENKSVGVFNGKVLVRQDAQKINAYQSNKSVVLDDTSRMYSKPELEIYADDVRCSHGATTGELDKDALFYLQARGIRQDAARLMLLEAFASDVLDRIKEEPVRAHVDQLIRSRLSRN